MTEKYISAFWIPKVDSGIARPFRTVTSISKNETAFLDEAGKELTPRVAYQSPVTRDMVKEVVQWYAKAPSVEVAVTYLDNFGGIIRGWFPNDFDYFGGIDNKGIEQINVVLNNRAIIREIEDPVQKVFDAVEMADPGRLIDVASTYRLLEGIEDKMYRELTTEIGSAMRKMFGNGLSASTPEQDFRAMRSGYLSLLKELGLDTKLAGIQDLDDAANGRPTTMRATKIRVLGRTLATEFPADYNEYFSRVSRVLNDAGWNRSEELSKAAELYREGLRHYKFGSEKTMPGDVREIGNAIKRKKGEMQYALGKPLNDIKTEW